MELFTVEIPDVSLFTWLSSKNIPRPSRQDRASIQAITWCLLNPEPSESTPEGESHFVPLLAFAGNGILYIFDVESRTFRGVLRGHGRVSTSCFEQSLQFRVLNRLARQSRLWQFTRSTQATSVQHHLITAHAYMTSLKRYLVMRLTLHGRDGVCHPWLVLRLDFGVGTVKESERVFGSRF